MGPTAGVVVVLPQGEQRRGDAMLVAQPPGGDHCGRGAVTPNEAGGGRTRPWRPLSPAAQPVAAGQPAHRLLPSLHGNASYLRGT